MFYCKNEEREKTIWMRKIEEKDRLCEKDKENIDNVKITVKKTGIGRKER